MSCCDQKLGLAMMILWLLVVPRAASFGEEYVEGTYEAVPMFSGRAFSRPDKLLCFQDRYLLIEEANHRVLVYDSQGNLERQIGSIGQRKMDLLDPDDHVVTPDGWLFLIDHSMNPIKIFEVGSGRYKGGFGYGNTLGALKRNLSLSLAVNSRKEILLSQPLNKTLVTIYDQTGKKIGGFGEKIQAANVYGKACETEPLCADPAFQTSLNRVQLAMTEKDHVYVAFSHAPLVRRYDQRGNLLFQTNLKGKTMETWMRLQWKDPQLWSSMSYNFDGRQVLLLINGIGYNSENQRLLILVGSHVIYILNPKGEVKRILYPTQKLVFNSLTVSNQRVFATTWNQVFELELFY